MSPNGAPDRSKIFVVDDDASVLRGLARLLRSNGYGVETFSSAAEFLARSAVEGSGCILIDLRMPEMSGLELQDAIRAAGHQLPVIFISGNTDVPATVQAIKAGALDFLTKPFNEEQLLEAIRGALGRWSELEAKRKDKNTVKARFDTLTPREQEVAHMVARGMLNKQIGWQLGTTEKTVKVHRGHALEKLGVDSVPELIRFLDRLK